MRKMFVVLVSLFIGLSFGFITPSGISKVINNGINTSHKDSSEFNLEKSVVDENELYQNNENKSNNVNERSFILLNKNHRKIFTNHLFKTPVLIEPFNNLKVSHKNPQSYLEQQKSGKKHPWKQVSKPNVDQNKQTDYDSKPIWYLYPKHPKMNNLNDTGTPAARKSMKQNNRIKEHKSKSKANVAVTKSIMKIDGKHIEPHIKGYKIKYGDNVDNLHKKYNREGTIIGYVKPGSLNNKMRVMSYIQRRPTYCLRCGFVKANSLHRMTFTKKHETETFSPTYIDGPNLDPSLGNMYEDADDYNFERFIKETLAETSEETRNGNFAEKNKKKNNSDFIDTYEQNSYSKQGSSAEITGNSNFKDGIVVKRKDSDTQRRNYDKQVIEDYLEINNITDYFVQSAA